MASRASVINPGAQLQTITITAQRMSAEQKMAYDRGQEAMPSMTITDKAMTEAQ